MNNPDPLQGMGFRFGPERGWCHGRLCLFRIFQQQLAPNFESEALRAEFLRRKNIEAAKAMNAAGKLKPFPRTAQK